MYFTDDKKLQRFEREMKIVPNFERKELWKFAKAAATAKITSASSKAAWRRIVRISSERFVPIPLSQEIWLRLFLWITHIYRSLTALSICLQSTKATSSFTTKLIRRRLRRL